MPLPLSITLLASAFVMAILHLPEVAGLLAGVAVGNEFLRMFATRGATSPDTYEIPAARQKTPIGPPEE